MAKIKCRPKQKRHLDCAGAAGSQPRNLAPSHEAKSKRAELAVSRGRVRLAAAQKCESERERTVVPITPRVRVTI